MQSLPQVGSLKVKVSLAEDLRFEEGVEDILQDTSIRCDSAVAWLHDASHCNPYGGASARYHHTQHTLCWCEQTVWKKLTVVMAQ